MLSPPSCFSTERPDFTDAIILRKGASVEHVVISLHLLRFLVCRRQVPLGACYDLCFVKLGTCQCLAGFLLLLPLLILSASGCFPSCYERLKKNYLMQSSEKAHGSSGMGLYVDW